MYVNTTYTCLFGLLYYLFISVYICMYVYLYVYTYTCMSFEATMNIGWQGPCLGWTGKDVHHDPPLKDLYDLDRMYDLGVYQKS